MSQPAPDPYAAFKDLPHGLEPCWRTSAPNEPVSIYDGRVSLLADGKTHTGNGSITLKWHPTCRLAFEASVAGGGFSYMNFEPESITLLDSDGTPSSDIRVLNSSSKSDKTHVSGIARAISHGDGKSIRRLLFHVPNFPDLLAQAIRQEGGTVATTGRHQLENGDWSVTFDRCANREIWKQAQVEAATCITHVGSIERVDGKDFDIGEVDDLLEGLRMFFSFCRTHWTGPILLAGFDADGQQLYRRFQSTVVTPARSAHSWISESAFGSIESLFPGFMNRWNDKDWKSTIRTCVYYFVDASLPGHSAEGGLVEYWAVFEALGWREFVLTNEYSADEYYGMAGSAKLEKLLEKYSIDSGLPTELGIIATIDSKITNGAEAVAAIRNACAHPSPRNLRLLDATQDLTMIAFRLAAKYAVLCLLRLFNYQGVYLNRFNGARWVYDAVETVPWKAAEHPETLSN